MDRLLRLARAGDQIAGLLPGECSFTATSPTRSCIATSIASRCCSTASMRCASKHVLVVAHYGCGGVKAAHGNLRLGLVDNWLRHIQDVKQKHAARLAAISDENR